MTTPASAPRWLTSAASPGVGITPATSTRAPPLVRPAVSAASSMGPLSRVSRPITNSGCGPAFCASTAAAARPTWTANSGVSRSPATPRMPSVPKYTPTSAPPERWGVVPVTQAQTHADELRGPPQGGHRGDDDQSYERKVVPGAGMEHGDESDRHRDGG